MNHGSHRPPDENERLRAVVLLSGGLDSATCLAMAHAEGYECHALSVAYGQRHEAEMAAAGVLRRRWVLRRIEPWRSISPRSAGRH
jgi:tRNA(Ile)-lysidine synthase TilS/MesJ